MQTISKPPKPSADGKGPRVGNGPLSSRNSSVLAAVVTAALAGLVIMVFLNQYRDNVNKDGVPTPVLVASQLIEQGASGDSIGADGLFKTESVPRDQLKAGAITDAAVLRGQIAADDILPGQQLTAGDFKDSNRPIVTKLGADERAISVALDAAHGMIGKIRRGDKVDVFSGFLVNDGTSRQRPILRTLMQDVLVLDVPTESGGSGGGVGATASRPREVTLRVKQTQAPKLAFASDNGKVWIVLRPQNGTTLERQQLVTLESLLLEARATPSRADR